jgi:DNA mismatch endonuclease (patch repair protein)
MALPYPVPTSAAASAVMRANRKADTGPELALRTAMHRLGLRYLVRKRIDAGALRVIPDVVFSRARVALFVDGCWWHRCPDHGSTPRSNTDYWLPKLARNVERDQLVSTTLADHGWTVVRIWEHEVTADAEGVAVEIATRLGHGRATGPR